MATGARNWRVAYTRHPGCWDDPRSSVDFAELVRCDAEGGRELLSAFLTTFQPWSLSFLASHFGGSGAACADTTLFVTDNAVGDCECDGCDQALRHVGGRVWTCNECGYDLCSDCVSGRDDAGASTLNCTEGHPLEELIPGVFEEEEGALLCDSSFDEDIQCYRAHVRFNDDAPHRLEGQFRVVVPRRAVTFCVHPKVMVLNFGSIVRVVVSSFNMSERQRENAGDVFWWADLPLGDRPGAHLSRLGREPCMHAPLHDFLCSIGGGEAAALLDRADWRSLQRGHLSASHTGLHVIASIPGEHNDKRFGLRRLEDVLRMAPAFPRTGCPVRLQVWSMGGSSPIWYQTFVSVLTQNYRRSISGRDSALPAEDVHFIVQTPGKGHCTSFDERMVTREYLWEDTDHPLMKDSEQSSVSWGWHSKVMYRTYPPGSCCTPGCNRVHGWAYVGSHNCSAASWGSMGRGNISIRNYELGVVVTSLPAKRGGGQCGLCLNKAVPIPWSSMSSLLRYQPTPGFIANSFASVKTFTGIVSVCDIANYPRGVKITAKELVVPREDGSDEESGNEDDGLSAIRALAQRCTIQVFIPKHKWISEGDKRRMWPAPVGTAVTFDWGKRYGIAHIY